MNFSKYLCCFLVGTFLVAESYAQAGVSITPSAYTAVDEVTIRVDLALLANKNNPAETMASEIPYVWLFSNAGDAKTNDVWNNQTDAAKMTQVSGTIWEFKFQPDTLFQKTPGELASYGFLIKNKNGSKQTVDFNPPYKFDPLVFIERDVRMFPSRASQDDLVYLFFKNELSDRADVRRINPQTVTISAYDATNTLIGTAIEAAPLKTNAQGVKYFAFHPKSAMAIPEGKTIKQLSFSFTGTDIDTQGNVMNVTSDTYTQELYNAQ
jgi:hypothetical protein